MEYRLASEGNSDELRQWLRAHPDRVNVPAQGSNVTLLYSAISNANRSDLASLQAGRSPYLKTVRLLCEEYKADVLAPNGATYNNALHLAASIGATDIVHYLVDVLHTPTDRTNVFGERAVQMAERGGHTECVAILQRAAAQTASAGAGLASVAVQGSGNISRFQSVTVSDSDEDGNSNADGTSSTGTGPQRQTSSVLAPTAAAAVVVPRPQYANPQEAVLNLPATQLPSHRGSLLSSGGSSQVRRAVSSTSMGNGESPPMADTAGGSATNLPQPVRPRKEYDITKSRILANPDLQGFRSAYGDGFKYVQCSDHYEIRGILPYTYRGAVYYTPVIISVYAPASTKDAASTSAEGRETLCSSASDPNSPLGAVGPQRSSLMADSSTSVSAATELYCRYRVCLDMQHLNDFAVSRKAEYIDPISGAIIPAPGDDKYQTLTAYIRNVVVRNFESVAPLIVPTSSYAFPQHPNVSQLGSADNADPYRHHHSHNAPGFMKNALPARSAAHIRCAAILRDLSKFGDGLGRYFPANHRIVVYVPVFSERKAAVLAMPQERPYTTTVDQVAAPASPGGTANAPKLTHATGAAARKAVSQQVAAEAVAELQVRVWIQFTPVVGAGAHVQESNVDGREGGVYAYPPRVYLIDAAAHPPAALTGSSQPAPNTLTGTCFASILRDRDTGEVNPEHLKLSQESWSANGSVYEVLVELQRVLRDTVETFAISYTGRIPASTPVQQANATANAYGQGFNAGATANLMHPPVSSPLDTFFTSPTAAAQPPMSGMGLGSSSGSGDGAGAAHTSGAGHCLYCYQSLQTRTLLQPCGHDGMCGLCVQRLQSHCREEVIACPVCRGAVRTVMEVFL